MTKNLPSNCERMTGKLEKCSYTLIITLFTYKKKLENGSKVERAQNKAKLHSDTIVLVLLVKKLVCSL